MNACKMCGFLEDAPSTSNAYLPNVVTSPSQQLADLESEIARVNALLQQLVQKRGPLKREINARFVPILRLPPEISSEIFSAYISSNTWDDENRFASPLILSQVCSSWRRVASYMPRLWSSIQLDLNEASRADSVLVEEWLMRAGRMPLSIYAFSHLDFPSPAVLAVIDVLALYSEQWSHIAFDLPYLCYGPLRSIKKRLPNLQYLSLNNVMWDWDEITADLDMFSVAPRLRNVFLEGDHLQTFVLPTNQLTKLSVECDYIDECVTLLRSSPHVIDCAFRGISSWDIGESHLFAARLESLELCVSEEDMTSEVFDCITIPAIRKLSCSSFTDLPDEFPRTSFTSLVSRSSCFLQALSLHNFQISDPDFIDCLRAVPSLCDLSITNIDISNEVFRMLNPFYPPNPKTSSALLPNLKSIQYTGDLDLDLTILVDFLRSRWERGESAGPPNVSRLDSVKILTAMPVIPDPPLLIWLQYLAKQGMAITLVTTEGSWP